VAFFLFFFSPWGRRRGQTFYNMGRNESTRWANQSEADKLSGRESFLGSNSLVSISHQRDKILLEKKINQRDKIAGPVNKQVP